MPDYNLSRRESRTSLSRVVRMLSCSARDGAERNDESVQSCIRLRSDQSSSCIAFPFLPLSNMNHFMVGEVLLEQVDDKLS